MGIVWVNPGVTRSSEVLSASTCGFALANSLQSSSPQSQFPADLSREGFHWPGCEECLVGQAWTHLRFLTFVLCGVYHIKPLDTAGVLSSLGKVGHSCWLTPLPFADLPSLEGTSSCLHLCPPHPPTGNATLSPLWKDPFQYLEREIPLPVGALLHPIQPC